MTPSAVQLQNTAQSAVCGGQYTNAINGANITAASASLVGATATAVYDVAEALNTAALGIPGAAGAAVGGLVPYFTAKEILIAAKSVVTNGSALVGAAAGEYSAILSSHASGFPNCDTQFVGTVTIGSGASVPGLQGGPGLSVQGDSLFYNNVGVSQDVNVGGVVNTNNLNVANVARFAGPVESNNLSVFGTATIGGPLVVGGNITTTTLNTTSHASIGGNLTVGGTTTFNGPTQINNSLTVTGTTTLIGPTQINNSLIVTGTTTTNNLTVTGSTATNGITNTGHIGTATISTTGGATIGTTLKVAGDAAIDGALKVGNGLTIGGQRPGMSGNGAKVTLDATDASLVNSTNHGVTISHMQTTITGGTSSTALQLDDFGARFSNVQTGGPARVTGVADGVGPYDAVNVNQLGALDRRASIGISSVTAMANIPQLVQEKTVAIGVGIGSFNGHTSLALGGHYRISPNVVLKASAASSTTKGNRLAAGMGASLSW